MADYTKREIDQHFQEIKETLEEIKNQTIKTNGRVSSLENWKSFVQGGLVILSLMVVPILIYVVESTLKH